MSNRFIEAIKKSDIFSHFISIKYLPRWLVLCLDVVICSVSLLIVSYLNNKFYLKNLHIPIIPFTGQFSIIIASQLFFFWFFHTYSGILRYSGFVDASKLFLAVFGNVALLILIDLLFFKQTDTYLFNYTLIILYGISSFFFLFLLRLAAKSMYDFITTNTTQSIPVMIYGTKSNGISIAKMLQADDISKYRLVGFIDNDREVAYKSLLGLSVYELTAENVKKYISKKAKGIIVSPLKMKEINPNKDLDIFIENGLKIFIAQSVRVWDGGKSDHRIKSLQIEDLLERPSIEISTDHIASALTNKIVLVTGAAGSIGSEIVKQCVAFNPKLLILLDQAETPLHYLNLEIKEKFPKLNFITILADVRNNARIESIFREYRPEIIFHAAAYKHVPLVEENPTESIQVNVMGTKNLADLAVQYNVSRFVMISTDKAVNPTNVMGASKRIAEIYVQSLNEKLEKEGKRATKFITTRFGNVLGSNGSVIPLFKHQIEIGGPVTVTHPDIIRYFMTIPEACMLVLEAGSTGKGGEIFVFDMGEPVKIYDLAKKMIRLSGFEPNIDIPIQFTGLRPGEKLYEELLNSSEKTQETHHPKIMIASVREYDFDEISVEIEDLINKSFSGKNYLTVSKMKTIVPEFVSNNSVYEKLDIENK
jgi:FlaA1/EpsC-like NDP-sugar epimerase